MKILITESQSDNLIKSILKQNGIKIVFGYKNRSYDSYGKQYDSVYIFFNFSNLDQKERNVYFETRGYKVIGIESHGDFTSVIDEFKYLPKDLVYDYFISRAKTYVEKILPSEH
jgi:hypothetical protein